MKKGLAYKTLIGLYIWYDNWVIELLKRWHWNHVNRCEMSKLAIVWHWANDKHSAALSFIKWGGSLPHKIFL